MQHMLSVCTFLVQLLDIADLMKPVSNVHPSICMYVRAYVCPSTKSFCDFSEICHVL